MSVQLLTEHHLALLSLKEGCTGWSESTLVKMPHCWESHVVAHFDYLNLWAMEAQEQCGKVTETKIFSVKV